PVSSGVSRTHCPPRPPVDPCGLLPGLGAGAWVVIPGRDLTGGRQVFPQSPLDGIAGRDRRQRSPVYEGLTLRRAVTGRLITDTRSIGEAHVCCGDQAPPTAGYAYHRTRRPCADRHSGCERDPSLWRGRIILRRGRLALA